MGIVQTLLPIRAEMLEARPWEAIGRSLRQSLLLADGPAAAAECRAAQPASPWHTDSSRLKLAHPGSRKNDGEAGALPHLAFNLQLSSVALGDMLDNGQTQTGAASLA